MARVRGGWGSIPMSYDYPVYPKVGDSVVVVNVKRGKYLPLLGCKARVFWSGDNGFGMSAGIELDSDGSRCFIPMDKLEKYWSPEELAAEEARAMAEAAEAEAARVREMEAREAFKALFEKCGFGEAKNIKREMGAWSDYFEEEIPFSGDVSDEEISKALSSPPESSYGALRWSNGRSVKSIDRERKVVVVSESISLCD